MDFGLDDTQTKLQEDAAALAAEHLNHDLRERDREGRLDRDAWQRCADFGVQGANVPQEWGGRGYDLITTVAILEGLGKGCRDNALTLALNGQMWAVQEPILRFGSDEQKQRFLPGLCDGSLLGAHGMTEPGSGSDAFSLATTARETDDGFVLDGSKTYIGLGPVCDVALIFATTDRKLGRWGLSAFLVDADAPGFRRGPVQEKMGLRAAPMGELHLHDCHIPTSARLGPAGAGASIFNHSMEWERSFIFASHVGAMARQLDETVAYGRERRQFGKSIGAFQSVSNRVADMKLRLDTARLLIYRAAWLKDRERPAAMEAALAKLHIGESFLASSLDAMRINGGRGYLSEAGVERDLRDSAGGVIYSGTSDIQREVIARLLGL